MMSPPWRNGNTQADGLLAHVTQTRNGGSANPRLTAGDIVQAEHPAIGTDVEIADRFHAVERTGCAHVNLSVAVSNAPR